MIPIPKWWFVMILLFAVSAGCTADNGGRVSEKETPFPSIKDVPVSAWESLSKKKIFFGHQSVGSNIIDGIKDVIKAHPEIRLNIVETSDKADFNVALFGHSRVGQNRNPASKNRAFRGIMQKGVGNRADIAFFKYCYVDIRAGSDISRDFEAYRKTMDRIQKEYPRTTFIHVTTPLVCLKVRGVKAWIKRLIGRTREKPEDNIKRNEFNDRMRKAFGRKARIFDLARIESTYPDGSRCTFTKNGKTYYAMVPEYTNDGGHLNETGRKLVAEQLLVFLSEVVR